MGGDGGQEGARDGGLRLLAYSWRSIPRWRWLVWGLGLICFSVYWYARRESVISTVFSVLGIACFAVSVPPWRWPRGPQAPARQYHKALADYRLRLAAAGAGSRRPGVAREAVPPVPARFTNEAAAVMSGYRRPGLPGTGSTLSAADRWEQQVALRQRFESFATAVQKQAQTAQERAYSAHLDRQISQDRAARAVRAARHEQALRDLIDSLARLEPAVPQGLIDARRAQLEKLEGLHRAVAAGDPEAARTAAVACMAAEGEVRAREAEAFREPTEPPPSSD